MEPSHQKALQLRDLIPVLVVCGVYAALLLSGITCPIKQWTGISCPGCGMTRAWLSVLHGDFFAAFSYHPLFWFPLALLPAPLLRHTARQRLFWILLVLTLLVWLIRFFLPNDTVVTFAPQEGWLVRFLMAHL